MIPQHIVPGLLSHATKKEKVEGARRVWGTFSMCTASAIHNTIKKLCGIDSVRVKRKTKELSNGKMCWWFVLHDEEAKLQAIDAKWEQVEFQTVWKLEPCFRRASTPVSQQLSLPQHGDSSREHILNHHCLLQRLHQMWLELLAAKHLFWQIVLCIHLCELTGCSCT